MKRLITIISTFVLGFSSLNVNADSFDPESNVLTLDLVTVGNEQYTNVEVRLDQYTVLNAELIGDENVNPVSETCNLSSFTRENYDAIQPGISFDQVTQIMGCKNDPSVTIFRNDQVTYAWTNYEVTQMFISVTFDESSSTVSNDFLGDNFKFWQGRAFVEQ